MNAKYQRGELSLFWAAVFVGVVTLGAVAALFSMRYERNFFGEAWQRVMHSDAGKNLQQTGQMAQNALKSETAAASSAIHKCMIDGKVTYSNVECDAQNPTSRKVELHDTQGAEGGGIGVAGKRVADAAGQDDRKSGSLEVGRSDD